MYEIHITCLTSQSEIAKSVAAELKWKTSEIARDPVLGNDTYYYLTTHTAGMPQAYNRMLECVDMLLVKDVKVLREKIEHIIHDNRFK